jgi:hypothetical protein
MHPTPPCRPAAGRTVLALAFGTALLAAPAAAANAQVGKLIKRAVSAATETATGTAGGAPGRAANGAAGASRLEITAERLDAFVTAMRPAVEGAAAEQRRGGQAVRTQEARATYAACIERAADTDPVTSAPPAFVREYEQTERTYKALVKREQAQASAEFQSPEQTQPLADSVAVFRERLVRLRYPAARACGPEVWPATSNGNPVTQVAPVVPAGMTAVQFGLLRERVAAWLVTEGRAPGYGAAERQALAARRTALAPLAALFRKEDLVWRTWGDVQDAP